MKRATKVNYLRIGLNLAGIGVSDQTAEKIALIYEGILQKEGKFSIKDAVGIQCKVDKKYQVKTEMAKGKVEFKKEPVKPEPRKK
jgi:glutamate 5-kinase